MPRWFLAIALMLNAKNGISSYQLTRSIGVLPMTAYRMQRKIREQMQRAEGKELLTGIVEAGEAYLGGKPRYSKSVRAYWTKKTMLVGAIEHGGRVAVRVGTSKSSGAVYEALKDMIKRGTRLITTRHNLFKLLWIFDHQPRATPLRQIGLFFESVKRAYYCTHHHYSLKEMELYLAEACYRYNRRKEGDLWREFLEGVVN